MSQHDNAYQMTPLFENNYIYVALLKYNTYIEMIESYKMDLAQAHDKLSGILHDVFWNDNIKCLHFHSNHHTAYRLFYIGNECT